MLATLLTACSPASDIYRGEAEVAGKDAVVFLHGYYGSALREKGGGPRRFIVLPTIIAGSFAVALESGPLGLRPSPDLEVEGLMARVSILPFFYDSDIYGGFLESLSSGRPVVALAYDWRQDLYSSVGKLDALVKDLEKKGAKSVSLVAHSMGGLVSAYYLAYGAQAPEQAKLDWSGAKRISKVVFLGVPFGGTIAILRNMQHGTGYPWNTDLLEAGTVASWPASYHLIPLGNARMIAPSGKEFTIPLQDPAFWEQNRLGLLHESSSPAQAAARQKYTATQIHRAYVFQELLRPNSSYTGKLKVLTIRGRNRPTLAKGYFDGKELVFLPAAAKKKGLRFAALEEDGDGSVPLTASELPVAFRAGAKEVFTGFPHDRLFADPAVEKECLDFLTSRI